MKETKKAVKIGAVLFWICIWQLLALWMDNQILLVGPVDVLYRLFTDIPSVEFWQTVLASALRITAGFLMAFALGSLFGIIACKYSWFRELSAPLMGAVKSVPVASFVVILLIWFGSGKLSIWISFLIVLPNLYYQVLEGMGSADKKLLEMAKVYRMPAWNKAWYLYRPALAPFLRSGVKVSIGMAWKSGVAAEVIGLPDFSIGESIYMSKIYLDTAGVFSWTIVCIMLSVTAEKIFMYLLNKMLSMKVPMVKIRPVADENTPKQKSGGNSKSIGKIPGDIERTDLEKKSLVITNLSKRFGDKIIWQNWNAAFEYGKTYAFMEPSGIGKTTLFRILSGLEKADAGQIMGMDAVRKCAMAFQENRSIPYLTAEENLRLVCPVKKENIADIITEILPEDCLKKPLQEYSGGMAKRLEVLRCMLSGAEVLLLDEPLNGLDQEAKTKTVCFIQKYQRNRLVLVATHSEEEQKLFEAEIVKF